VVTLSVVLKVDTVGSLVESGAVSNPDNEALWMQFDGAVFGATHTEKEPTL
jgi:hypothetical protein